MTEFWMLFSVDQVHTTTYKWDLPEVYYQPIIAFETRDELSEWVDKGFGCKVRWNGDRLTITTKKFNGGNPIDISDHFYAAKIELGKDIEL